MSFFITTIPKYVRFGVNGVWLSILSEDFADEWEGIFNQIYAMGRMLA